MVDGMSVVVRHEDRFLVRLSLLPEPARRAWAFPRVPVSSDEAAVMRSVQDEAGVRVARVSRVPMDSGGEVLVCVAAEPAPAHSDAESTAMWLTLREMRPLRWADGDAEILAALQAAPHLL